MYYIYSINMKNTIMKKTRFSIQTNILESNDNFFVTLMCHFKLEGVRNTNTMFEIKCPFEEPIDMNIDDMDRFKTMCQVFGVSQKKVIKFIDKCIDIAVEENEDITINHESAKWLRHPETIELFKRQTI